MLGLLGSFVTLVGVYVIGSVSGALVLAPLFGAADPRGTGSHSAGATNAWRVGGAAYGLATLAFDLVKGAVAIAFVGWLVVSTPVLSWRLLWVSGAVVIAAHVWPVFHGFRGGKGAATAAGVFAILFPVALLAGLLVAGLVLALGRIVSLATLAAAVTTSLVVCLLPGAPAGGKIFTLCALALLVATHRTNLARLFAGTEPRIGRQAGPRDR